MNLAHYPQNLEVRAICEEEYLTSALICMLMTIFDKDKNMENTVCLHILCALFNLMNKSKIIKTKEEVREQLRRTKHSTILFEPNALDEHAPGSAERERLVEELKRQKEQRASKLELERSKTYVGYKLMWVMRMFLQGKKFPAGTLSSFKWRMYVFDIVRFITTP